MSSAEQKGSNPQINPTNCASEKTAANNSVHVSRHLEGKRRIKAKHH